MPPRVAAPAFFRLVALSLLASWGAAACGRGGERGTAGGAWGGPPAGERTTPPAPRPHPAAARGTATSPDDSALVVRVLDVGQGDATLVTDGGSRVLVDGGADPRRLGVLLDSLGLRGETIDVVVVTHAHLDHYRGLQTLFDSRRATRVRFVFENRDVSPNVTLAELRDSIAARVRRGETVWRDTDDPCGDGRPVCTVTLRGGARLHVLRPDPRARTPNERSTPVKLVAADSTRFAMWLAGDAERGAIGWIDRGADYDRRPGMDVHVLKAGHHGSCDGTTSRLLDLVSPQWVVVSLGADNDYGHVHAQTKRLLRARGIPWYRTDLNGTITIRAPGADGAPYAIEPQRGAPSLDGPTDRRSGQAECRRM
ncbi:MAG TPA: MBL fold metallo-hydrolase [Gemmatimonadaceae bacterium]